MQVEIYKIKTTAQNLCFVQSWVFCILNFNKNHNFLAAIVENLAMRIWWSLESILWNKVSARGLETNLINLRKISRIAQQLANIIWKDVFLKQNLNVDMFHFVGLAIIIIVVISCAVLVSLTIYTVIVYYCGKHNKCGVVCRCK